MVSPSSSCTSEFLVGLSFTISLSVCLIYLSLSLSISISVCLCLSDLLCLSPSCLCLSMSVCLTPILYFRVTSYFISSKRSLVTGAEVTAFHILRTRTKVTENLHTRQKQEMTRDEGPGQTRQEAKIGQYKTKYIQGIGQR